MLNQIDREAFATEQAQVQKEIADRAAAQWLTADAPQRAKIQDLANELAHQGGVPKAAAYMLAKRIVELEYKVSMLETRLDTERPAHMRNVEKRA